MTNVKFRNTSNSTVLIIYLNFKPLPSLDPTLKSFAHMALVNPHNTPMMYMLLPSLGR